MTELDYETFKARTREAWALGEYAGIAQLLAPASEALVEACAISAGQEVLDVAAGTGNLALAAAREGAAVVASDLTPALIEQGRARAAAEGVEIEWVEADAEELPFEDGRFDCAASAFGAIFAPRPEVAARELFRVVRPGNTVGMATWVPGGFSDRLFELYARYAPPPEGLPRAIDWGVEEVVRERFKDLAGTIEIERRTLRWEFESLDAAAETMGRTGPSMAIAELAGPERAAELARERRDLVAELSRRSEGTVVLEPEYLLVVARKRG